MPWHDWQFYVVTAAALLAACIILRQLVPKTGSSGPACGACATGPPASETFPGICQPRARLFHRRLLKPPCVLAYLNDELHQVRAEKRFLAIAFAIYDHRRRTLEVANAGLPYPLLLRGDEIREIEAAGVPVGAMARANYRHVELQLEAGDVVIFTTDGIDECLDPDARPFGHQRVRRAVESLAGGSARQIADGLLAATERHLYGQCEPSDDRTVVVLRVGDGD